jgi:mono/diheme cytochrome c family protein
VLTEEGINSMLLFRMIIVVTVFSATATLAADVNRGRDIATHECAACHPVGPQRNELADAPPFDLIGRKRGFDAGALAYALLEPHPKMNFALTQREAEDVAAYISTLAK